MHGLKVIHPPKQNPPLLKQFYRQKNVLLLISYLCLFGLFASKRRLTDAVPEKSGSAVPVPITHPLRVLSWEAGHSLSYSTVIVTELKLPQLHSSDLCVKPYYFLLAGKSSVQGGGLGGCSVKAVFRAGIVSINEPKTPGRSSLSALICLKKKKKCFC